MRRKSYLILVKTLKELEEMQLINSQSTSKGLDHPTYLFSDDTVVQILTSPGIIQEYEFHQLRYLQLNSNNITTSTNKKLNRNQAISLGSNNAE